MSHACTDDELRSLTLPNPDELQVEWRAWLSRGSYAVSAILVGVGCGSEPDASVDRAIAGPAVTVVDSVLLDENDRFYLGNPFSLVVDTADGSFLISDFFDVHISGDRCTAPSGPKRRA